MPWYLTDWFYVALTLVVFGFLYLIVKGIETFERENWIELIGGVLLTIYLFVALVIPERF